MSIRSFLSSMFGPDPAKARRAEHRRHTATKKRFSAITAANNATTNPGWPGMSADEDGFNQDVAESLGQVIQRAIDVDINNPDAHGMARTRIGQILGRGVQFKAAFKPAEVGLTHDATIELVGQINRMRELHSANGGFDAAGLNRSEGKQQERAYLTALVCGCCLIHRVWRRDRDALLPLAIELIPGTRISTPYERTGSPTTSYGVEYEDDQRTRVVGWWVRHVAATVGNSFIPVPVWDFVPVEDGSLLALTEIAGLDRSLPYATCNIRMLRNRGEFIESATESARAQATYHAHTECAPGADPFNVAADDADQIDNTGYLAGFTSVGGGVQMLYSPNGEKVTFNAAKLPDPNLTGFFDVTDERCARGFATSVSRFTRKVNNSWAGGRLEDQQDDPIVDQLRETFICAWRQVHRWFIEAIWLTDAIKLPGYNNATRCYWSEFRSTFPGKLHINESQTMQARAIAYMLRSKTPQHGAEEDGFDLRENYRQWAEAIKMQQEAEKDAGLPGGTLEILLQGKVMSTTAGAGIAPPKPDPADDDADEDDKTKPLNDRRNGRAVAGRINGHGGYNHG